MSQATDKSVCRKVQGTFESCPEWSKRVIPLSKPFQERIDALFKSQQNRARQKKGPSGRISKRGYELPFDKREFTAWFLDRLGWQERGVISCRYCNRPIDAYSCVVDHEIPLKRGGSPGLHNLGLPCEACNQIKGGMTPEEYIFFLRKMQEMALEFHNGQAVQDITSRLQKAVKLAAAYSLAIARKQKAVVAKALDKGDNF